ncbi:MAG: hypothetical protein HC882_01895 [Acidobacteria bacterium]|nr:hypothetical protein [Acidobacteriota bacterium]
MKNILKKLRAEIRRLRAEEKKAAKGNEGRLYGHAANCAARAAALEEALLVVDLKPTAAKLCKRLVEREKTRMARAKTAAQDKNYHAANDSMHAAWSYAWVLELVDGEAE